MIFSHDMSDKKLDVLRKYKFYEESVQNPEGEVNTLQSLFENVRGRKAKTLREDFCGTGAIMCNWVKQGPDFLSLGIDLDPEPVEYGKNYHLSKLSTEEQSRVNYIMGDVLEYQPEKVDLAVAQNFSYYIFKKRKQLVEYFSKIKEGLNSDGVFVLDLFGGPESMMPLEEETEQSNFSYFWDCDSFNPITNECIYHIHFKPKGEPKYQKVFTYDWRMWSFPELREILEEVGFQKTIAFWEDDDEDGEGNGEFSPTEKVDNCEGWIGYIVALN